MIINVGGRTDIVNYYTPWLINRLNEEYVITRNPYNHNQLTRYDLSPSKVDAIIFCSKNYKPILEHMPMIEKKYSLFCYYTITAYDKTIEPKVPDIDESIETLKDLSHIIGKEKISWRYDPILLTEKYSIDEHFKCFEYITSKVHKYISFSVFSFVDMYNKVFKNMPEILEFKEDEKHQILTGLIKIANKYNMPLQSCAVSNEYEKYGIRKSGCVTSKILEDSNNITFKKIKHRGMRNGCTCLPWRDIGEYDTCLNGCKYCYANKRPDIAEKKYRKHNPKSPILIGNVNKMDKINNAKQSSFLKFDSKQQRLI